MYFAAAFTQPPQHSQVGVEGFWWRVSMPASPAKCEDKSNGKNVNRYFTVSYILDT